MKFSVDGSFEDYKSMIKFLKKHTDVMSKKKALVSGGIIVLVLGMIYIGLSNRYSVLASIFLAIALNIIWVIICSFVAESDKELKKRYDKTSGNKEYIFNEEGFTFHYATREQDIKETFPYQKVKFALALPIGIYMVCMDDNGNNYEYMMERNAMDETQLQELDRHLQFYLGYRYIYFYNRKICIDRLLKTKAIVSDPYVFQNMVNGKMNEL